MHDDHRSCYSEDTVCDLRDRIAELEKALRYWLPDETLVPTEHAASWAEHVKLLRGSEFNGTGSAQ